MFSSKPTKRLASVLSGGVLSFGVSPDDVILLVKCRRIEWTQRLDRKQRNRDTIVVIRTITFDDKKLADDSFVSGTTMLSGGGP
jgi:hypothetical protein